MEVWRTFEEFVKEGKVRNLGISNCYSLEYFTKLFEAAEVKPRFLQNRFYAESGYDKELRDFCRNKGVIYQSFWTLTANPHVLQSGRVQELAKQYKKTPAQIFYTVLMNEGFIPLIGTTSEQHMK